VRDREKTPPRWTAGEGVTGSRGTTPSPPAETLSTVDRPKPQDYPRND